MIIIPTFASTALWKKGELEAARQHFLAGLRQDPGNTEALLDLGELLVAMDQQDEADEKFRRVIELAPEDPSGHFYHGQWLMRAGGRDDEAMTSFHRVLQLDPTYPCAHMRLGELYQRLRNRAEARRHLRAELLLRPDDSETLLDLSNLLLDNGQSRAAIACLKRMTSLQPADAQAWHALAVAQFIRGLFADGISSCERAIEIDPKNVQTYYNIALAHERVGNYGRALVWVRRGLDVDPKNENFQKLEFRFRVMNVLSAVKRFCVKLMIWR